MEINYKTCLARTYSTKGHIGLGKQCVKPKLHNCDYCKRHYNEAINNGKLKENNEYPTHGRVDIPLESKDQIRYDLKRRMGFKKDYYKYLVN